MDKNLPEFIVKYSETRKYYKWQLKVKYSLCDEDLSESFLYSHSIFKSPLGQTYENKSIAFLMHPGVNPIKRKNM